MNTTSTIRVLDSHICAFRDFSRDVNPLHTDVDYAKKTIFGYPVVYGIATVFLCLSKWLENEKRYFQIKKGKIKFHNPIYANEEYLLEILVNEFSSRLIIKRGKKKYLSINLELIEGSRVSDETKIGITNKVTGRNFLYSPSDIEIQNFYNNFSLKRNQIPENIVFFLAWTSYFVGMEEPGKQALYSQLQFVTKNKETNTGNVIEVEKVVSHDVFGNVQISGTGNFLQKFTIDAFSRPMNIFQQNSKDDSISMRTRILEGKRAFITGGTRGLGRALVEEFLRNGANVTFTYRNEYEGYDTDIHYLENLGYGKVNRVCIDLLNVEIKNENFNEYDFFVINAIPAIRQIDMSEYDCNSFTQELYLFNKIFINSVFLAKKILKKNGLIINMSTSYLDESVEGYSHYVTSKAFGEEVLRCNKIDGGEDYINIRIPKMLTDQTNSNFNDKSMHTTHEIAHKITEHIIKNESINTIIKLY